MLPVIKQKNNNATLQKVVPSFQALVQTVEAAWMHQKPAVQTPTAATPTITVPTSCKVHGRLIQKGLKPHRQHNRDPTNDGSSSASSSGSTDIALYRHSPSGSVEDDRAANSTEAFQNAFFHATPTPSSSRSRGNYWDVVLGSQCQMEQPPPLDGVANKHGSDVPLKPFVCPTCSLRFRKRCNLITHISNVHDKIRPFYCSLCMRRFARKSNCSKHVSKHPPSSAFVFSFPFLSPIACKFSLSYRLTVSSFPYCDR